MSTSNDDAERKGVSRSEDSQGQDKDSALGGSAPESQPPDDSGGTWKSKFVGVFLALLFGPLGLFYSSVSGALTMIVLAVPLYLITRGGWFFTVFGHIACAVWAYVALYEDDQKPNPGRDSVRLLDKAAALERTDIPQAVAIYQEIIRLFPDTSASREAIRNIQTLTRQK